MTKLKVILADPKTTWQVADITWPHGTIRWLELGSGTALGNQSDEPILPISWILSSDLAGQFEPRVLFSTVPSDTPASVVTQFARRWIIKVIFKNSRAISGGDAASKV